MIVTGVAVKPPATPLGYFAVLQRILPTTAALLACCLVFCAAELRAGDEPSAEALRFFETHVRPLLAERCIKCHGPTKQSGELRLDSRESILKGGESGTVIEPGDPAASLLIEAINYESFEMPPDDQLADEQIATLTAWVKMGAPWTPGELVPVREPDQPKITDQDRAFWSYQPLQAVTPPAGVAEGWARNDIDRFVWRKLAEEGLTPAPEAPREQLIRRVYFDVIGLPPTPEEVSSFVNDPSPQAYEQMVDRLLDSPRYGEHWARHWLDLVRYAESDGFKQDAYRPNAWRYRDYVIRSLNDDKPYDRFVIEQLAGDEVAPHDPDALTATGYLRNWIYEYNQRDVRTQWSNILNDITDVTGDVFLGMGMGCARCHDHKFDPILQRDYFRLQAFFSPLLPRDDVPLATPDQLAAYQVKLTAWQQTTADIRRQIDELERPVYDSVARPAINKFPPDIRPMLNKSVAERAPLEQQLADLALRQVQEEYNNLKIVDKLKGEDKQRYQSLQQELATHEKQRPPALPTAYCVTDVSSVAPQTVIPGDRNAADIAPGFLTVLDPANASIERPASADNSTGRRTALARWIASPDNPLSTRVIVNRVWQYHFGRGLVETSSDFGHLGQPPTHPELLDWLTRQFLDGGWRLKPLHRLILTSATYRQSALREPPEIARLNDPENRLLWRMNSRRLDAEQIRDAMLAVSGELQYNAAGPSVNASQPRRTVYTKVIRNAHDPLLEVFDAPDGFSSVSQRNVTTTPTQSLLMINGPWTLARARAFAARLTNQRFDSDQQFVESAYQLAFGRQPNPDELESAVAFLQQQAMRAAPAQVTATPDSVRRMAALAMFEQQARQSTLTDAEPSTSPLGSIPNRAGGAALFTAEEPRQTLAIDDNPSLPAGDFTIEAVIVLHSLFPDASVRTIAAQWDSDTGHPGWALGITSEQSKHQPRNLILQLVGNPAQGGAGYEVVASDLRPELNKPYYVAASVKIAQTGESGVTFYLKDLSQPDAPLQTAHARHKVTAHYRSRDAFTIGGRDRSPGHFWDGAIDDVRLSDAALGPDQLLVRSGQTSETSVGLWRFDNDAEFFKDSSGRDNDLQPVASASQAGVDPYNAAVVDFCHVLLNSNEFLYVD